MTPEMITLIILIIGFIGSIFGGLWHISRIVSKFETSVECLALAVNDLKAVVNGFESKVDNKLIVVKDELKKDTDIKIERFDMNHKLLHAEERHGFADKLSAVQHDLYTELDKKVDIKK